MSKESVTKTPLTRRSNRVEFTEQEALFTIRALETQVESLGAQADWPAIIPFSKQSVIDANQSVITKIKQIAHLNAATEAEDTEGQVPVTRTKAKPKSVNGGTAEASA